MTESWALPDGSKLLAAILLFFSWGCTSSVPRPRYVVDMRTTPFTCFAELGSGVSVVSCDELVYQEGDLVTFMYEEATDFVDNHGRMSVVWDWWGGEGVGLFTGTLYYTSYYSAKWGQSTGVPASVFSFLIMVGSGIVILILGVVLLLLLAWGTN